MYINCQQNETLRKEISDELGHTAGMENRTCEGGTL